MAMPKPKADALAALLAARRVDSLDWTAAARNKAEERLRNLGLPEPRDEYWRFTRPGLLTAPGPQPASVFDASDERPAFAEIDRLKIVFVDGVFDPKQSDPLELAGLEISLLADSSLGNGSWARALYGTLEERGQSPVPRPLSALNTFAAKEGVAIRATGQAPKPVSLVYIHNSEVSDAYLHHLVRVEPGASVTILESGPAAARLNNVTEISVADGGTLHHVRAMGRDHERQAVTHLFAELGAGATFKSFTLTANGILTRNEAVIEMLGDNAVAHVAGAALGDGDFHHDDTVFVTHEGVNCESRQVFKKVLRNGATGVFQGKILVKSTAQKTDGYQISQSLLLDGDSTFLAKPELEIYADDVACSHGSTSGAIDETALFYLRSRGIPADEAQDLLVLAFIAEAIEEIDSPEIAEDITRMLSGWLERRH